MNKRIKKANNHKKGNRYRNILIRKATKHELIFKEALTECGIIFSFQKLYFNVDKCYIIDFYIKTETGRYAIELDGKHHKTEKQRKYDLERSSWMLKKRKTKTIRFDNSEIENDLNKCVAKILMLKPKKIFEETLDI